MKIRNTQYLFPLITIVVFLITYSYTFDQKLAPLGDNASYYMLGKALSTGKGYVNISNPGMTPNNHYPPGYPALMSVFMHVTGSVIFFKLLNGVLLLAGVLLLFFLIKIITGNDWLALFTALFALVNFHLLQYGSMMMSEVPYLFLSLLSLYFFSKVEEDDRKMISNQLLLSLLFAVAAYYTRSLGIALIAAICLSLIVRKSWGQLAVFGGGFILLALPWYIRAQNLGGGSYMKQLKMVNPYQPALGQADTGEFVDRFFRNIQRYITTEIPTGIFPVSTANYQTSPTGAQWFGGLLLLAIICYGLFRLKKLRWALVGYILATLAILMIWPDVWVGVRFIVPIIPLLGFGFLSGLYSLLEKITLLVKRKAPGRLLIVPVIIVLPSVGMLHKESSREEYAAWTNYYAMGDWLRKNEKDHVVIACGKPSLFYIYSGTFTRRYAFEQDPEKLINDLIENHVDYVVIDQVYGNTMRYLLPAVRKHPEMFQQVYHVGQPDTFLLKFNASK